MEKSPTPCRIVIVDDHPIFREGLILSLGQVLPECEFLGQASGAQSAVDVIQKTRPDVVILDLILAQGSGLDVIFELRERRLYPKILILSQSRDPRVHQELRRLNVDSILSKTTPLNEIVEAIQALRKGSSYFEASIVEDFQEDTPLLNPVQLHGLTAREVEVVRLVASGRTQKEIADLLGCAPETVKTHKGNLLRKLGARNSVEIVAWATRARLI